MSTRFYNGVQFATFPKGGVGGSKVSQEFKDPREKFSAENMRWLKVRNLNKAVLENVNYIKVNEQRQKRVNYGRKFRDT